MPLLDIWSSTKEAVLDMNIQQIVSMAGDGTLKDQSECAAELREFFTKVQRQHLQRYAQHCLEQSFVDSGFVLQDIINEVGRRLGMSVQNGIYRGKQNNINSDSVWKSKDWTFVVEVKTTDAYAISLDKIAKYFEAEIADGDDENASCLIVVGRKDTSTLEDQVRGSKHNWKMRIVGVEALFKALELKELSEDPSLTKRIIELLIPQEYTRIDHILSTAYDFASDREEALVADAGDYEDGPDNTDKKEQSRTVVTDRNQIEQLKVEIADKLSKKFSVSFNRNRSMFENDEAGLRFAVAVSKPYERRDKYWYAYHPRQIHFLDGADSGYFVLGCSDTGDSFAIPREVMNDIAQDMLTTSPNGNEEKKYHHVVVRHEDDRYFMYAHPTKKELSIDEYIV